MDMVWVHFSVLSELEYNNHTVEKVNQITDFLNICKI